QQLSFVIGRSANNEISRRRPPRFFKPFEVGFEAAGRDDKRLPPKRRIATVEQNASGFEVAVAKIQLRHLSIVENANTSLLRGRVEGIHEGFAAAQKKRVRAAQMQGSAKRRLKSNTVAPHPVVRAR